MKKKIGRAPAVALVNPKFPHNVGAALRACSCFNVEQLWWTSNRVTLDHKEGYRLPREERMKGYKDVEMHIEKDGYIFDMFDSNVTPVAIELRPGSEMLPYFEHPENPLYVFGPEDGSLSKVQLMHCHKFVVIPTAHCVNLSAAVYLILYDRLLKRIQAGKECCYSIKEYLKEDRGFISNS